VIWLNDIDHGRQIAHAAGTGYDTERDRVISRITSDGNLMGGFVFTNFSQVAIQVHMAGFIPNWCSPTLLVVVFEYVFNQLKVDKLIAPVPSTNIAALEQDKRAGFVEMARLPGLVLDGDMIVLSMSREQCRWLKLVGRYLKAAPSQELAA
jgi:hypothetical protein